VSLNITINTGSNVPIFKQIVNQVRLAVTAGKLTVADPLPSVRALAETLVLNPNTVARAYADLAREGLIESRPGRGVFIIQKRRVFHPDEGRRRLEPLISDLIGEAMAMDLNPEELRAVFEKKLGQWKHEKGGKRNDE
jgi:GntR family transcriptional regulator